MIDKKEQLMQMFFDNNYQIKQSDLMNQMIYSGVSIDDIDKFYIEKSNAICLEGGSKKEKLYKNYKNYYKNIVTQSQELEKILMNDDFYNNKNLHWNLLNFIPNFKDSFLSRLKSMSWENVPEEFLYRELPQLLTIDGTNNRELLQYIINNLAYKWINEPQVFSDFIHHLHKQKLLDIFDYDMTIKGVVINNIYNINDSKSFQEKIEKVVNINDIISNNRIGDIKNKTLQKIIFDLSSLKNHIMELPLKEQKELFRCIKYDYSGIIFSVPEDNLFLINKLKNYTVDQDLINVLQGLFDDDDNVFENYIEHIRSHISNNSKLRDIIYDIVNSSNADKKIAIHCFSVILYLEKNNIAYNVQDFIDRYNQLKQDISLNEVNIYDSNYLQLIETHLHFYDSIQQIKNHDSVDWFFYLKDPHLIEKVFTTSDFKKWMQQANIEVINKLILQIGYNENLLSYIFDFNNIQRWNNRPDELQYLIKNLHDNYPQNEHLDKTYNNIKIAQLLSEEISALYSKDIVYYKSHYILQQMQQLIKDNKIQELQDEINNIKNRTIRNKLYNFVTTLYDLENNDKNKYDFDQFYNKYQKYNESQQGNIFYRNFAKLYDVATYFFKGSNKDNIRDTFDKIAKKSTVSNDYKTFHKKTSHGVEKIYVDKIENTQHAKQEKNKKQMMIAKLDNSAENHKKKRNIKSKRHYRDKKNLVYRNK